MKKINLSDFREDPDNVSEATDEEIARLAEKLRRVPAGLAAMRIAYVTDCPPGKMVISGNKRLRCLKAAFGENGEAPAEWFQDVTAMSEAERHEFRLNANISDGHWNLDKLLEQYAAEELTAAGLDDLLGSIATGDDAAPVANQGKPSAEGFDFDNPEAASAAEADNPEYQEFVDKFKPKKTTDDCYTPKIVYNTVADWVAAEYSVDRSQFVRPFYPGGDYRAFDYSGGKIVVDNPPFSIISEIVRFYAEKAVPFFIFAPGLTLFSGCAELAAVRYVIAAVTITYANGANVMTNFITSLGDAFVDVRPDLHDKIKEANDENLKSSKRTVAKLQYPMSVATAARLGYLAIHGIAFRLQKADAVFIRKLDAQKGGDSIFGGGLLLSERAAAERAAAERAAAERAAAMCFTLSEREIEIRKRMEVSPFGCERCEELRHE
jgi:hypothetical protein